jgi:hypothetical protein
MPATFWASQARSTAQLWADRFYYDFTDLSALRDVVTGRIAWSLHIQLVKAENRRSLSGRAADPDAIDLRPTGGEPTSGVIRERPRTGSGSGKRS